MDGGRGDGAVVREGGVGGGRRGGRGCQGVAGGGGGHVSRDRPRPQCQTLPEWRRPAVDRGFGMDRGFEVDQDPDLWPLGKRRCRCVGAAVCRAGPLLTHAHPRSPMPSPTHPCPPHSSSKTHLHPSIRKLPRSSFSWSHSSTRTALPTHAPVLGMLGTRYSAGSGLIVNRGAAGGIGMPAAPLPAVATTRNHRACASCGNSRSPKASRQCPEQPHAWHVHAHLAMLLRGWPIGSAAAILRPSLRCSTVYISAGASSAQRRPLYPPPPPWRSLVPTSSRSSLVCSHKAARPCALCRCSIVQLR